MSAIMYERAVDGTTIGLRIVTDSGDEIDYSSGRGLTIAIEAMSVHSPREARPFGSYVSVCRWGGAARARNGPTDRATRRPTEMVRGRRYDADREGRGRPCRPS
jgi:hypothetical protein